MRGRLPLPFFYGWLLVAIGFMTMTVGVNARTAFSSERGIDAGLPQIGRFEHVGVGRQNQGQHRHLLSDLIAGSTFGNRPIAVKVSAVSDPCPAAVKVGLGSTRAEPVVMRTAGIGAEEPKPRRSNSAGVATYN
jgi:hypothetical protein